jgi:endoglycosylceramidase
MTRYAASTPRSFTLAVTFALSLTRCGSPPRVPADTGRDVVLTDVSDLDASDAGPTRYAMPPCAQTAGPFAPLSTRCQHFVDARGRVAVLRGVNARVDGVFDVTFNDGRTAVQPIPAFDLEDAQRMRQLGFNFLRLPINWSGIEPERTVPATYNDEYLARVRAVVDLARRAGLLVLIDFHQDAYSKEIGEDGAPLWAIEPPPEMVLQGPITPEELTRRRTSGQVIRAFETFFGSDGRGPALRARFAEMTAEVARRFRGDDVVIGYEIYNEPLASDEQCLALHAAVGAAIRAVDPSKLLVFEPPATRNIVDRAMVPTAVFPLPGAVYAPHIYTLALAASDMARRTFTVDTLRPSHANAVREARGWGTPLLVTEWGYDPNGIRTDDYVAAQGDLQDEYGESAALWLWKERSQGAWGLFDYDAASGRWSERASFRRALARVYPEAIAGWPRTWQYDRARKRLELAYEGSATVTAPTVVYVPAAEDFSPRFTVTCDGRAVMSARDPATGRVEVGCSGPGEHTVVVQAAP